MKEYKYDEESVNALIEWTKTASIPRTGHAKRSGEYI